MGASSSISRTDFKPNSAEISKAVVLSFLASLDNAEGKAALANRYSYIRLENIVMAHDFIMGESTHNDSSTVFVAFRWRFRPQDMFSLKAAGRNEFSKSYPEVGKDVRGLFNNELFQRVTDDLPSISYFSSLKADKIIFTGHSLAGSLAHLFLICYMLNTREEAKRHISIGFGSPYFCDGYAKQFCEKNMELDRRMFTLVNGADPVPWLLAGIRMTESEKVSSLFSRLVQTNSEEKIEIRANMLEEILQDMDHSGSPPVHVSVGVYYEGKVLKFVNSVLKLMKLFNSVLKVMKSVHSEIEVELIDVNAWHCRQVECYVEEFSFYMNEGEFPVRSVIEKSSPCIDACNLNIYHGPKSHEGIIEIRGLALSELKHVNVVATRGINIGREWMVEKCSNDSTIVLCGVLSKTETVTITHWENDENTEQKHLCVRVKTCFGSTVAEVNVINPWRDSYVAYALNRAMGRLLLMQKSKDLRGSAQYSEAYGSLHCVFRDSFDLSEETKREHCETVKLMLTGPLETPVPNELLQKLKDRFSFAESAQGLHRKLYVIISPSLLSSPEDLCSVIPGNSCISMFANQNESSSNENRSSYVYCICDNKLRKLNYLDILSTIYCLLSGDTEAKHEQSVDASYYEEKIHMHVHRKGQVVKRGQGLPEGIVTDIQDRAWKIHKIISAYKLLQGFKMAAFIGPENVGKTTLINSILGKKVGEVGFTTHTPAATLHWFTNDIFIIDFPGIDAGGERTHFSKVWRCYENVADLCIVVVSFGGDTCRATEQFLRIARSLMCENVVLVINRVDSVLNGSRKSPVWVEYSPSKVRQLRKSFGESCKLPTERVFLSVSVPREELDETTCHLLEERPTIMMKEEITRKLRWLLCGTQATFNRLKPLH